MTEAQDKPTKRQVQEALLMVLNSTLVSTEGHDWHTCQQSSCIVARKVLPKEWL